MPDWPDNAPGLGLPHPVPNFLERLKESPHDPETWKRLINDVESSGDISRIREAYDALLEQYPGTASAQTMYLKHFTKSHDTQDAEELFQKFLPTSASIELWNSYLTVVRHKNTHTTRAIARENIGKAFEFAVKNIGHDRDSGPMWAEYIQFLNAAEGSSAWDASQKVEVLRKTYHRCVQIPLDNVESLWSQYEAFEMGLNKTTAKKFLTDLSPAHMHARAVLRQLTIYCRGLGMQPGFFLPAPATFCPQELQLISHWKTYLKWEEGNPLGIEEALLLSRVRIAYRKAVIRMRYYPEIWFMAYSWTTSVGRSKEALPILEAGLEANPDSFALTYTYAELLEKAQLEQDRDFTEIHAVYERFLGVLRVELARLTAAATNSPTKAPNGDASDPEAAPAAPLTAEELAERKRNQEELLDLKKQYSNAWNNYMRFARRAQGYKAAREVFGKARKDKYIGWEVYETAAMMENRCNLEDGRIVATRIFETGMKTYSTDATYVLSYLGFLLTVNDENNARALFERVIGTFTPEEARPIWERWSRSQCQYDDLEAVLELERRMAEVYPNDTPIKRFARRHTYQSIDAIADHDLGFAKIRKSGAAPSGYPLARPNMGNGNNIPPNAENKRRPAGKRSDETASKRPRLDERDRERSSGSRQYSSPPAHREPPPRQRAEEHMPLPPREPFDGASASAFSLLVPPFNAISFLGPIFNPEDLLQTLRRTMITSSTSRNVRSPPPPATLRSAGRPPPDYGPYQGPTSQPTRGRG
ncbi:Suf-domain-containing protein [Mycena filopes]|nr:Suf-domain-containing protein [Mycena filopes]